MYANANAMQKFGVTQRFAEKELPVPDSTVLPIVNPLFVICFDYFDRGIKMSFRFQMVLSRKIY
jgi:hypothetical protein